MIESIACETGVPTLVQPEDFCHKAGMHAFSWYRDSSPTCTKRAGVRHSPTIRGIRDLAPFARNNEWRMSVNQPPHCYSYENVADSTSAAV